ncbi:MAG TPA: PLP-dependent transferase [Papillibacter sp.]|jgi:cystathionine gamma-synthase|nr:PLP-dependent transferase [Papillibacter sp.]
MDIGTLCVHGSDKRYDTTGAVSVPIFQSATFTHPGVGQSTGFDYSRVQNPTREYLEDALARLEGGTDAFAFSSGMAATAVLMELFSPGDHFIVSDDLYGGSVRYFRTISEKNGLTFDAADTGDLGAVRRLMKRETKAVFVETPTNPMMQVTDLAALSEMLRQEGVLLIVDNTFLTPYFQRPLQLGADIVLHSGTKYLGGHNDTLAGFLVTNRPEIAGRLRQLYKTVGACLAPFDSWLIIRGLKTLAVRLERQAETAEKIARWLLEHPRVTQVLYPGLPEHPGYDVMKKQTAGFGAMVSFKVESAEFAVGVLERVRLIQYAESLGGVESLITYPILQTHADLPEEVRRTKGIDDRLLRLSVGLESAQDLMDDLAYALEG